MGVFSWDELLTTEEDTFVFDVESYYNYFLVGFKGLNTNKYFFFEEDTEGNFSFDKTKLSWFIRRFRLVSFNGLFYDIHVVLSAINGKNPFELKMLSNEIIGSGKKLYTKEKINHIDLIEVCPIKASLKIYSGRIHCRKMQDLPYPHDKILTLEEKHLVREYNCNDLDNTQGLFLYVSPQIKLREDMSKQYEVDLRSKSDAQIAETVMCSELKKAGVLIKKPNVEVGHTFYYKAPEWMEFITPELQNVLEIVANTPLVVNAKGSVDCPKVIKDLKIKIGNMSYQMGIGGLHSCEKSIKHLATDDIKLIDIDAASMYPTIILYQGLYPKHLGPKFLVGYKSIVDRRLEAKRTGDKITANSLKICVNGSFGKFGNQYSMLYAPEMLTQVTLSGQLCLLMCIEAFEYCGFEVISANTDGIITKVPKDRLEEFRWIVKNFEETCGFTMEETHYKAVYSANVNNFIIVTEENKIKAKGLYTWKGSAWDDPLSKNPETLVCLDALYEFLATGKPIRQTIYECQDVRRFVSVRTVQGGSEKDNVYLGKAIRWYYAKGSIDSIKNKKNGHKVPKTEQAKPLMTLPDKLPDDIDYVWYIDNAEKMLLELGYKDKAREGTLL